MLKGTRRMEIKHQQASKLEIMRPKADCRELSDNQLVDLLKNGDERAFAEILDRYYALLLSFVYRRVHDKEQSRDLVHDMLANIWEKREDLVITGVLGAYLIQCVKNIVIDHYKHQLVKEKYVERFAKYLSSQENGTDHLVRHNDLTALIEMEVAALPEKMRVVFELSRKEAMNRKEISDHLKIPENTVKTNMQRALRILRDKLPLRNAVLGM